MPLMGITAYARHRGVSLMAVQQAVKANRITRQPDGLIDSDLADEQWQQNTRHEQSRLGTKRKKDEKPPAVTEPVADAAAEAEAATGHIQAGRHRAATQALRNGEGANFNRARAEREEYNARIARLDYEERLGNLVSRKQIEAEVFNSFRILRDHMLNIPDRVAAMCAAESDSTAVYEILAGEIRRVFQNFSDSQTSREHAA